MENNEKDDTCTNWKEKLFTLLEKDSILFYFNLEKIQPASRHEVWFLVNAISNVVLIKEIEGLREDLKLLSASGVFDTIKSNKKRKKLKI